MNPSNQPGAMYKHPTSSMLSGPPSIGLQRGGSNFLPQSVMGGARFPGIPGKYPLMKQEIYDVPKVSLYRCSTVGKGADVKMEDMDSKDKVSVAMLEQAYQVLMRKDIKDSLTSFISNIPGDFENQDNPEGMLRSLIDKPPIGGREFLPISEHSLLGFRLHPGSLPEQYQLDPPTLEPPKHHKKKKKHKHKYHDKLDENSLDNYSPITNHDSQCSPVDPCDFIKPEQTDNFFVPPPPQPSSQPILSFPTAVTAANPHLVTSNISHHPHPIIAGSIPMMVAPGGQIISANFASSQANMIVGTTSAASGKFSGPLTHSQIQGYQIPNTPAQVLLGPNIRIPTKPKKKKHDNGEGGIIKKKKKEKKEKRKKSKHHGLDQPPPPPAPPSSGPSSHSGPPPLITYPRPP